jgi:uncharacterized membrane protein YdcZ (DUF606 family)
MGSPAVASLISHAAFWGLLVYGWARDELSPKGIAVFLLLWLAGLIGLPYVPYGAALFSPVVAALDIALVFVVLKGDVRLT